MKRRKKIGLMIQDLRVQVQMRKIPLHEMMRGGHTYQETLKRAEVILTMLQKDLRRERCERSDRNQDSVHQYGRRIESTPESSTSGAHLDRGDWSQDATIGQPIGRVFAHVGVDLVRGCIDTQDGDREMAEANITSYVDTVAEEEKQEGEEGERKISRRTRPEPATIAAATEGLMNILLKEVEEKQWKGKQEDRIPCLEALKWPQQPLQLTRQNNQWADGTSELLLHPTTLLWTEGGNWAENWGSDLYRVRKEIMKLKS
jgi:hypothetical protein